MLEFLMIAVFFCWLLALVGYSQIRCDRYLTELNSARADRDKIIKQRDKAEKNQEYWFKRHHELDREFWELYGECQDLDELCSDAQNRAFQAQQGLRELAIQYQQDQLFSSAIIKEQDERIFALESVL